VEREACSPCKLNNRFHYTGGELAAMDASKGGTGGTSAPADQLPGSRDHFESLHQR
jgi:hypothetical protein